MRAHRDVTARAKARLEERLQPQPHPPVPQPPQPLRKAKSVIVDAATKEPIGAKRKREVLVEVTGLANNNKPKGGAGGLKGKDGEKEVLKDKEAVVKPKAGSVKPPSRSGRVASGISARRLVRATSESTTASRETETTVDSKPSLEHVEEEPMQIDEPHRTKDAKNPKEDDDEEAARVFKRRHTEEKPVARVQVQDDSQAEADAVAAALEAAEPSVQLWDDLDADDWDDPVMVSEYVADVCVYLKQIEVETLPDPNYMDKQEEITWDHRGVLVDWLLQVHARFNLNQESLFLTVNVLDRFLGVRPISLSKLQLVGLASFFIATKFEETYAPSIKEVAFLSDGQYTAEEILKAERYILRILEWDLRAPGPLTWLRRATKADECEVHARTIGKYLIEISLVERRLVGKVPSLISAAAMWLGRLTLGREEWVRVHPLVLPRHFDFDFEIECNLEHYTTYSEKELLPVAKIFLEYILTNPAPHESLYKKYTHKRYFRCSAFMRQWAADRWHENADINIVRDLPQLKEEIREIRELQEAEERALARAQAAQAAGA
ncbi:hypothetical protein NLJ89_g466 [Agrocybe chaxingu]|uniref:Cyclin N-terminal domain-containing protein n=1 Tax=Agrocybe chaxingu TaxID=84603 RepID=A0A9W8TEX3_9AGAR|nr:hypothetical protein NLJ89_g466 [Agrocybe chaxingu]